MSPILEHIFPVSVYCNYFIMKNIPAHIGTYYRHIAVYAAYIVGLYGMARDKRGIRFNQCNRM